MERFETTRWSLVLAAQADPVRSRRALETLCETYRSPVLAYIRSHGSPADEAEDLTQAFFARFVERADHAHADPVRGRFRAFLLTALKNFLTDAHDRAHAAKRGGYAVVHSLDSQVESMQGGALADEAETPERAFDRAWARTVLQTALNRLRDEADAAGKSVLFAHLREFLIERPDEADYARVAQALSLRRNTLAVAVHRLRRRLRELVCAELAETAVDDDNLGREIEALRNRLAGVLQLGPSNDTSNRRNPIP